MTIIKLPEKFNEYDPETLKHLQDVYLMMLKDFIKVCDENQNENKKYFYQLDGEGIRYELVAFIKSIELNKTGSYIDINISKEISSVMEDFCDGKFNELG